MRTVIYARFSSQLQKDSSIEDQLRVCNERADREGWQVVETFTDYAISGAVRERPGLNALLEQVAAGGADIVLSEAIDRLSRDQEDLAAIYKRVAFHGARIVTLSEGPIDELQIGFKGTMASLFRKDLADKIRRGQRGRVAVGRIPGNIVYGYRKVIELDARGEPVRGLREIDPDQAEVVRRIYREYLAGESPLAIARRLNAEGVPSPSGGTWSVSAINGDTMRGNGILCNPIYAGELVYNRTRMVRDPVSRKRVPRANPPNEWQRQPVPELAIVDHDIWSAVRARKSEWKDWSFHAQRRPQKLLSGLVRCGCCGGNAIVANRQRWACSAARNKGTCANRRSIENEELEHRVIDGLRKELLRPERVARAVREYHKERQRLELAAAAADVHARKRSAELEQQIQRLVTAISAGADDVPEVVARLREARAERAALADHLRELEAGNVIALHPNIADAYCAAIDKLGEVAEAHNAIRCLVDSITLTPNDAPRGLHVDIVGRFQAVMDLAAGRRPLASPARVGTSKVVAEEGLEPPTRGL